MRLFKRKTNRPPPTVDYELRVTPFPPGASVDDLYVAPHGGWGSRREEAAEARRIETLEARAAAEEEARHAEDTDGFQPRPREFEWPANMPRPPMTPPSIRPDDLP